MVHKSMANLTTKKIIWILKHFLENFIFFYLPFTLPYLIIIDTTIYSEFSIGQPLVNAVYVG